MYYEEVLDAFDGRDEGLVKGTRDAARDETFEDLMFFTFCLRLLSLHIILILLDIVLF
jgi:hypothetical protein